MVAGIHSHTKGTTVLKTLLGLFAKPLGAALNNALAAGSAAVVLWASQKGVDTSIATPIVAGIVNVISLTIAGLAATQGVQIPVINQDQTNGVRVVNAAAADRASIPSVAAPAPKA